MTNRARGLYVALSEDVREDDIQPIVNAILCLRLVANVDLDIADTSDFVARNRIKREIADDFFKILDKLK